MTSCSCVRCTLSRAGRRRLIAASSTVSCTPSAGGPSGSPKWDRVFDEKVVDRLVNLVGDVTFAVGRSLTVIQTGRLRQYVMFIAVGVVALFALLFVFMPTL